MANDDHREACKTHAEAAAKAAVKVVSKGGTAKDAAAAAIGIPSVPVYGIPKPASKK